MIHGALLRIGPRVALAVLTLLVPVFAASCIGRADQILDPTPCAYVASGEEGLLLRYAPVFLLQSDAQPRNRIGAPAAKIVNRTEQRVFVDAGSPAIYAEQEAFVTSRGEYTNLIYRVHFPSTPFWHITWGRNVGLFVIVTINQRGRPVLVTTLHTCGCYMAFQPTNFTLADALPVGWPLGGQQVHGESLPGNLIFPEPFDPRMRVVLTIRNGTHRVMNVAVRDIKLLQSECRVTTAPLRDMRALDRLPLGAATTPFFHPDGGRKGYVRGAKKLWEKLFIGWWALDLSVGVDKKWGAPEETGVTLYTSLKPWAREASNICVFPRFLNYWGWRL